MLKARLSLSLFFIMINEAAPSPSPFMQSSVLPEWDPQSYLPLVPSSQLGSEGTSRVQG